MSRSKGNWLVGIFIILIGIILLLNNVGIITVSIGLLATTYWPVVIILVGLNFIINRGSTGEIISGLVFVCIGVLLLGKSTGLLQINLALLWNLFWPIIIILIGFTLLFGHKSNGKSNFAIMGAIERKKESWILQNSSFVAFWGGIDLDLSLAKISDGETIVDLTAFMGGIEITVPEDIIIECYGTAILGGIELLSKSTGGIFASASSSQRGSNTNKVVKFYSRAIMGGIEIKNKKR